jgi:phenylalanyl-tRNA synthetase alpha chain
VRHAIPDIRLFWSLDPRFMGQFTRRGAGAAAAAPVQFEPFSNHPPCYKDVAVWVPAGTVIESEDDADAAGRVRAAAARVFHENDFHAAVREAAGDLVEAVERIDRFEHPKTRRTSLCFRVLYRAPDRSLTNDEVDAVQEKVREAVREMGLELR